MKRHRTIHHGCSSIFYSTFKLTLNYACVPKATGEALGWLVLNAPVVSVHQVGTTTTKGPNELVCEYHPPLYGIIATTDSQYRLSLPTDFSGAQIFCVSVSGWGGQLESDPGCSLASDPDCIAWLFVCHFLRNLLYELFFYWFSIENFVPIHPWINTELPHIVDNPFHPHICQLHVIL